MGWTRVVALVGVAAAVRRTVRLCIMRYVWARDAVQDRSILDLVKVC